MLPCVLWLAGCTTVPPGAPAAPASPVATEANPRVAMRAPGVQLPGSSPFALPPANSGRGGYYLDDGPGEAPPPNLLALPDAYPRVEPYSSRGNRPYVVFGKTYVPVTDALPMKQRGMGSWYGKKFHGQKTSSGELYDMYKMTAAHPTLPIPSYARVTNVKTGAQVIVRVNDRGPFHSSRIIDLSYTAALKLGYIHHGSTELEVERLLPDEIARINAGSAGPAPLLAAGPALPAPAAVTPLRKPALAPVAGMSAASSTASSTVWSSSAGEAGLSLDEFLQAQSVPLPAPSLAMNGALEPAPSQTPLTSAGGVPALPASAAIAAVQALSAMPAEPVAAAAAPTSSAASGFYLQFGAFGQGANAEAVRLQLVQRWPAGVPLPQVQQSGAIYRLYSGPFGSRADAQQAAVLASDSTFSRPLIVQR